MRKLTHEQFMKKFYKQNKHAKDIEILGTYVTAKTKIKCKCKIDGHIWETKPNSLLRGSGCPKCVGNIKLTHEEFINRMKKINSDIEVLGTYVNRRTKIKCRCKIDGYEWEATPNDLLKEHGCPKCYGNNKKTTKEFINELKEINNNIEIFGEYKGNATKIKCKCKIDDYEWEATPANLLQGHGCPKCAGLMRRTHEEFINELNSVNPNIEILSEFENCKTKIKCKCKIDGYEWETKPNNLLHLGQGCPKCNITKGEKRVAQYLDNLGIEYIYNKCYFKDLLAVRGGVMKPDFIIPSLKIWIEYDGIQHFEPVDFTSKGEQWAKKLFKQVQQNDQIKNQYAKDNNWTLIRIPYWDMDNIEQILNAVLKQEQAI